VIARRPDHLLHAFLAADVPWVDAQARGTAVRRVDRAFVVEVDVGDDRHIHFMHDVLQRQRALLVWTGHAHDIHARQLRPPNLRDRARDIRGQRVGHGLHGDWRAIAHRHAADIHTARLPPDNLLVRPVAHTFPLRMLRRDARR
jgi:hypothetical protein